MRSSERLREEKRVRVGRLDVTYHPFPEGKGFGVRIIDAEDANALVDPKHDDVPQLRPQRPPLGGGVFEIQRIDILVLLGRVFRVLDRAVRARPEPFPVLTHIGVIRRALKGDVERDFKTVLLGLREEPLEIPRCAQLWVNRRMTAFGRANRPRATDVIWPRSDRVVAALAKRAP